MKKILKNSGFTLVELLVVMTMIGLLSGIVLVGLSNSKEKARDVVREGDLKSLLKASELYFAEHGGQFPQAIDDLGEYFADLHVPIDPKSGENYWYRKTSSPNGFCLGAMMETLEIVGECPGEGLAGTNDLPPYIIKGP